MGLWVYGFIGLWVYGFIGLWVYRFMGLWVYGFIGLWVYGWYIELVEMFISLWDKVDFSEKTDSGQRVMGLTQDL